MFNYEKRLEYPVHITRTDPKAAMVIISQYGGLYSASLGECRTVQNLLTHIASDFCICYNASRQNDGISPYRTTTKTPKVDQTFGVFYSYFWNGKAYDHRLVTDYWSPSNHLMM